MQTAAWTREAKPSFIREILKVTQQPHVISFAGGLPAPELFPVAEIAAITARALASDGTRLLQYSTTEGDPALRESLAAHLGSRQIPADPDQILLTNGSQHGLDLVAKALLDPGDVVLVENPTYLGALTALQPYRPQVVPLPCDDSGVLPDALATALKQQHPRMLYLMPTFQNPRGISMDRERRAEVVRLCEEAGVAVVEDDPYGELRYRGEAPLPLRALWDQVIYLGTQSKTMAPGLRLGWVVAPPALMPALKIGLQATCLNVGALVQRIVAEFLGSSRYQTHLAQLREVYGGRMLQMLGLLERHFPTGTRWSRPDGGLFVWVELPGWLRAMDLLNEAVAEGVAFVPGEPFFAAGGGECSLRLNFSNAGPGQMDEGMARLGRACKRLPEMEKVREA